MKSSYSQVPTQEKLMISISKMRKILEKSEMEQQYWTEPLSDKELAQEVIQSSTIKRFIEIGNAAPDFRQEVLNNFADTTARYNLDIEAEQVKFLWDENQTPKQFYQKFTDVRSNWYTSLISLADSTHNSRFQAWRERQKARCMSQIVKLETGHFPIALELSKGCSVGCWFCGVSAPRLNDIFFYTEANAKLWRDVLGLMKELLGQAAGAGFCYWATDPLDNPDYEKFLCDYHAILGACPQTTTAQALKNPERTRSLLKLSLEKGCKINRFSIMSLKILNLIYEEFTPDELAFVELVLQNPEAKNFKFNAGRARERNKLQAEKNAQAFDDSLSGTIACVTGFLFNMVDRTVQLISPCNASDRWPKGYRVYDRGTFTDIDDLKILLHRMIDTHMPLGVEPGDRIQFRPDLKYERLPDGFQLSTRFQTYKFRNDPYMQQLAEVILKGNQTAQEIAEQFNIWGVSSAHTFKSLNFMFNKGVFDDEPQLQN